MVSVPAPMIQGSAGGNTNVGALNNFTDHSGKPATRAAGTMANAGGVRGGMPGVAERQAKSEVKRWKELPFSDASIAIMETEFLNHLANENWKAMTSGIEVLQTVRYWQEKVQKHFGQYDMSKSAVKMPTKPPVPSI